MITIQIKQSIYTCMSDTKNYKYENFTLNRLTLVKSESYID